jgi:hypothetical protein
VVATRNVASFAGARPGVEILASDRGLEFARMAARLLREPALARRLALAGRRIAVSRFSLKAAGRAIVPALAALERSVAAGNARPASPAQGS